MNEPSCSLICIFAVLTEKKFIQTCLESKLNKLIMELSPDLIENALCWVLMIGGVWLFLLPPTYRIKIGIVTVR